MARQAMEGTLLTSMSPLTSSEPAAAKTPSIIQPKHLLQAILQLLHLILLQLSGIETIMQQNKSLKYCRYMTLCLLVWMVVI